MKYHQINQLLLAAAAIAATAPASAHSIKFLGALVEETCNSSTQTKSPDKACPVNPSASTSMGAPPSLKISQISIVPDEHHQWVKLITYN